MSNIIFFNSHLVEHTAKKTGAQDSTIVRLANTVSYIGQISYSESLGKIAAESKEDLQKLIDALNIDNDPDEETMEVVDEGNINYHDYGGTITQNHPNERSGVNNYSLLSVPEGFLG